MNNLFSRIVKINDSKDRDMYGHCHIWVYRPDRELIPFSKNDAHSVMGSSYAEQPTNKSIF